MKRRMTKDGVVRSAQARPTGATRRDFLKASAFVAGAGVWVAAGVPRVLGVEEQSANDRINIA